MSPDDVWGKVKQGLEGYLDEAVAKAVAEAVASKPKMDAGDFREFFKSLANESDRALPIVGFAYIDHMIGELMGSELNPEVDGGIADLLSGFGPLATASQRIKMAHALYWLSDQTAADLHLLRKVRNHFAHDRSARFRDDCVREWIRCVAAVQEMTQGFAKATVDEGQVVSIEPSPVGGHPQPGRYLMVKWDVRLEFSLALPLVAARAAIEASFSPVAVRTGLRLAGTVKPEEVSDALKELGTAAKDVAWFYLTRETKAQVVFEAGEHSEPS